VQVLQQCTDVLLLRNVTGVDGSQLGAGLSDRFFSRCSVQNRVMQLTRRAIRSWRDLAGLDNASLVDQAAVDNAVRLIGVPA
jgi:hypothetical protein